MVLKAEEGKARRLEGMKRAKEAMTGVEKIHRALVNGRPPASELKTPLAAVTAARVLHRELESRMRVEGLEPVPGDYAVIIAYVSADLSVIGITRPYVAGQENQLMSHLNGNIMLGLIFGMVDKESGNKTFVTGTRAFLNTNQTQAWLEEVTAPAALEMED